MTDKIKCKHCEREYAESRIKGHEEKCERNPKNQNKETVDINKVLKENEDLQNKNLQMSAQFEEMQKQMLAMQEMMKSLSRNGESTELKVDNREFAPEEQEILPNEYIKVKSLLGHTLNLTTDRYGGGKVFTFTKFNQNRSIPYSDLENIIHNNEKFLRNGCFVILDERVNLRHGLSDIRESILDDAQIEKVLSDEGKSDINLFITASDTQKKTIIDLFIKRSCEIQEDEVDYNKVQLFSKYSGRDVSTMLKEYRESK